MPSDQAPDRRRLTVFNERIESAKVRGELFLVPIDMAAERVRR
jgi:hypothetical protein